MIRFDDRRFLEAVPGAITWPREDLTPTALARVIDAFARRHGVLAVSMDGPHAWRDPDPRPPRRFVGRASEYEARTQGKTGPRSVAYPSTFLRWIQFSIDVFAALLERPDVALANHDSGSAQPRTGGGYWLMECFPTSTWRTSGLDPLPGHQKAPAVVVEQFARRVVSGYAMPESGVTRNHDDLQALVGALPAVGLLGGPAKAYARGEPARDLDGVLVEGFIWDAAPAVGTVAPVAVPPAVGQGALLVDERDVGLEPSVDRGVALFRELVSRANAGEALGISYKGFVEHVHGRDFQALRGRRWAQSDTQDALRLAHQVTDAAGRQSVRRGGVVIRAGMDTFIWRKESPHDRSLHAWSAGLPYTREQWEAVFPKRRLVDVY